MRAKRAAVAEHLQTVGAILMLIGLLWRLGLGVHAVASDPSVTLVSWDALGALLKSFFSASKAEDLSLAARLPAMGLPLGGVLWVAGWLLQPWHSPSKE